MLCSAVPDPSTPYANHFWINANIISRYKLTLIAALGARNNLNALLWLCNNNCYKLGIAQSSQMAPPPQTHLAFIVRLNKLWNEKKASMWLPTSQPYLSHQRYTSTSYHSEFPSCLLDTRARWTWYDPRSSWWPRYGRSLVKELGCCALIDEKQIREPKELPESNENCSFLCPNLNQSPTSREKIPNRGLSESSSRWSLPRNVSNLHLLILGAIKSPTSGIRALGWPSHEILCSFYVHYISYLDVVISSYLQDLIVGFDPQFVVSESSCDPRGSETGVKPKVLGCVSDFKSGFPHSSTWMFSRHNSRWLQV